MDTASARLKCKELFLRVEKLNAYVIRGGFFEPFIAKVSEGFRNSFTI